MQLDRLVTCLQYVEVRDVSRGVEHIVEITAGEAKLDARLKTNRSHTLSSQAY